MNMTEKKPSKKRQLLIDTALKLFIQRGIHSTGIDTIVKESGVAKNTLYIHFKSKDNLVEAALGQFSAKIQEHWHSEWEKGNDAKVLVLSRFDELKRLIDEGEFHGCVFLNAGREYPIFSNNIHQIAFKHKLAAVEETRKRLTLLNEADADKALGIEMIYEGLISKLVVDQDKRLIEVAKALVSNML